MDEPVRIGRSAVHHRLSELARAVPDGRGTYSVLTMDFDSAADPAVHGRDPEWCVMREGEGIVYRSASDDDVAAFLAQISAA